jgi:hypothetical protein
MTKSARIITWTAVAAVVVLVLCSFATQYLAAQFGYACGQS